MLPYLIVEIRRGSGKNAAVGPEHLALDVDRKVAQPALFTLPVQIVHDSSAGTRETHLDGQTSSRSTVGGIHAGRILLRGGKMSQIRLESCGALFESHSFSFPGYFFFFF